MRANRKLHVQIDKRNQVIGRLLLQIKELQDNGE